MTDKNDFHLSYGPSDDASDDHLDHRVDPHMTPAFGRLRRDTAHIDTMAALRSVESRKTRGFSAGSVAFVTACMLILVAGGFLVFGDNSGVNVTTEVPPASQPEDSSTIITTLTPPATPAPTSVPQREATAVVTSQANPEPTATAVPEATATTQPTVAPMPQPEPPVAPTPQPEPTPTILVPPTITPVPTAAPVPEPEQVIGTGPYAGAWLMTFGGDVGYVPGDPRTPWMELSGGRLRAQDGCWTISADTLVDGAGGLTVVPESVISSSAGCIDSIPTPDLVGFITALEVAEVNGDSLRWAPAVNGEGYFYGTTWKRDPDGTRPDIVALPLTPEATADAVDLAPESVTGAGPFAGGWQIVSDGTTSWSDGSGGVVTLTADGGLRLVWACNEVNGQVQTDGRTALKVIPGTGFGTNNVCEDPTTTGLADALTAKIAQARTAEVTNGGSQLRWTIPGGPVLTFVRAG